jgi:ADP-ribosylglycohydrolase
MYPSAGFSHATKAWLNSDEPQPYGSFTNGAAMRVSPIGWAFDNLGETLEAAKRSAEVSHDSEQGITAAQAVSAAVFMARQHSTKAEIKAYIVQNFHYDLGHTIEGIRPNYSFDCSCEGSVPEAIMAFMDGEDYESVIRLAVSLGGDSDTQACIAGGIAEAFYGCVPKEIIKKAVHHLPSHFRKVITDFAMATEYQLPKCIY